MDINAKLLLHIFPDGLTEIDDFLARSTATIHQHQCLLVMHTGTAQALALPSALIDHPSCRNLLMLPVDGIMRHTRILDCQSIILRLLYDRIHEEATRIALHLRVRQLGIADFDDDITKLLRCRMFDILSRQRCTDVTIVQVWGISLLQTIDDMGNEILVSPLMLELTLAIAVLAILVIENYQLAGSNLHSLHLIYNILCLYSVGTDILDSTRSNFARNNAQILSTIEVMLNRIGNHIIKNLAATTVQEHPIRIQQGIIMFCSSQVAILKHLNALDGRMEHRALIIACKQEITAPAQDEQRLIGSRKPSHNLLCLFYR